MVRLRDYQREAVRFLSERPRAILGDAPGVGKTATALSALGSDSATMKAGIGPPPAKVLVLCPLSVARHWEREANRWTGYFTLVGVGSAAARREARSHLSEAFQQLYITNYEAAKVDASDLFETDWDAVICDEAHRLKNRKTKTFKLVRQLALPADRFIAVTGTPILNRPDELWSLLHLVDPKTWKSYWDFVNTFCDVEVTNFRGKLPTPIKVVKGMRPGMDGVLRQQLRDVMIRRPLEELLPELPEVVETVYEVDLAPDERRAYEAMEHKYFADLPDTDSVIAPNDVAKVTRLRQIATDWSTLGVTTRGSTKAKRLVELLEDIGDEQAVIFSAFAKVIDPLAAMLRAGKITGSVRPNDRTSVIDAFRSGSLQFVCGTIGAMGEGIDLQTARHVVFLDLDWTPARNEQCVARVHRYGQRADAVFVHTIAARDTIDAYIAQTIAEKRSVIDAIVGLEWHQITRGEIG